MTARDFAQTLELCERLGRRAHGDRPPPRRAPRRQGRRPGLALGGARRAGPAPRAGGPGRRLRHRPRPRLQRRHRRRRAAADPELDDVRLRVGDRPAQRQLPPRARPSWCPTRSRPSACAATAPRGKLRRYEGLKEEYYLADFEPDAARPRRAAASTAARPIVVVRTPPERLALPPLRERPVRARARAPARGRRGARACSPSCCRGSPPSARELRGVPRLHRPRARDRRPVADRLRRPRDLRRRAR